MRLLFAFAFLLCSLYNGITAQTQSIDFFHLNSSNGLSNNQVECIFKDSKGFMWFATNSGLNRYDGRNFKIFKHNKHDINSTPVDRYSNIQEDANGNLWLYYSGIDYYIYNYKTERFIRNIAPELKKMGLATYPSIIEIDKNKDFYAYYAGKGIYKYEVESKQTLFYSQDISSGQINPGKIAKMKINGDYIWILHRDGLIERFNQTTRKVDLRDSFFQQHADNSLIIKSIFIDSDNHLWVYPGVGDKGIGYLNPQTTEWTFLNKDTNINLSNSLIRSISQDKNGLFWIGTDHGGVNIFDKKNKVVTVLKHDIYNNHTISQNSIISTYCSDDGIVWVGTYKNGLSYYHPDLFKFKKSPLFETYKKDSEPLDCNSLFKDSNDNLWIGTNGRGLIRYNEKSKELKNFRTSQSDPTSISSDIITSIYLDHRKTIWVGTFMDGLNAFDGSAFIRYQIDSNNPNSISGKSIYGLAEDDENNLWIGTLGEGIDKLDESRKTFTKYNKQNTSQLLSDYCLSMFTDTEKNIYISSDRGINVINGDDKKIYPFFPDKSMIDSLTNVPVNNVLIDSRKLAWIATDNGINIYNSTTRSFTFITAVNGLYNDEVVSLIEDNNGNIWAGTRNGLVRIDCQFTDNKLSYSITNFDINDGLPSSIFNQNSIFKDNIGSIYIGSTNGYICFNPNGINFNKVVPKPRFTDLSIYQNIIKPEEEYNGHIILKEPITDLSEIELNHDETNFTLFFSSLNYIHPEKNHYRYMLEGLDNQWTEVKNGIGTASYSNLNPGTYKLIVYASNNDGVWSSDPIVMKIIVKPPFWLSWWAFVIYTFIILVILRKFIQYKLNQQKKEFKQTQKIMEADKLHELDELKFRFFTNISHEFKTPITLILTPLDKLLKEPCTEDQRTLLSIMKRNAQNLLEMVNEILDFRKLDLKKENLSLASGDIISFTRDICLKFSSLAAEKSIKLTFTAYLEELYMDFDPEKLNKVLVNLLSNAFKYTESGHIDVSIAITEAMDREAVKKLCVKVSDTGIGIPKEEQDKIFDRFYRVENQAHRSQPGTGVGLHLASEYTKLHSGEINVESEEGKGSTFTIYIPIRNSSYKELKAQDVIHEAEDKDISPENTPVINNDKSKPVLLAVDDNEDFREFLTSLFSQNYHVITANNGADAYQKVLDQLPDIVLCDVMMPVMDGYEFCRKIKSDIRTSHIPVILLTAKSSEENQYSGIEAGADDYISKPFNIEMLTLKISKIIEKQKSTQSSFKRKIDVSPSEIEVMTMDEKFVKKAISIVETNIDNPEFLVEDLCREMAMSRVYFYKKILALTDKSPSEFIRFIRLKRAADLLEKSQMFVNEVAFQVGFNDPKYFRKYFKEEFSMTPNEYKKKFTQE
ncbi:two-component regulator propeller domain-containing protein [Dysgonomonas macrotermitis]|uniref:histidine kinase n=1 Tax=Dysgonomonas macrotermitis TaxID=1346286 RepID=A0A1M5B106_9BACT|nr:two-component regulator propeller domain-containing protein [Dysgonomonas macrotermitis]SHF35997.1 Signal transduction histidine kinase [Dysgonomonas macrotermitis]